MEITVFVEKLVALFLAAFAIAGLSTYAFFVTWAILVYLAKEALGWTGAVLVAIVGGLIIAINLPSFLTAMMAYINERGGMIL